MPRAPARSKTSTPPRPAPRSSRWLPAAIGGLLVLAVFVVFGRALNYGFSDYDDSLFVTGQPQVIAGMSWSGIVWAFTNGPLGEWYPLSMLSHMLDCQLYGLDARGHHLTNLLLHAASAVILFLVLRRMTGQRAVPEAAQVSGGRVAPAGLSASTLQRAVPEVAQVSGARVAPAGPSATALQRAVPEAAQVSGGRVAPAGLSASTLWPSAAVAALFAVHPLHVESVVWIAERRDVLSGLFFMLTLAAYEQYTRRPQSLWWYLAVAGCLSLGLMAKAVLVTVPAVLLLLDFWPLERFRGMPAPAGEPNPRPPQSAGRLILEKLPLVALCLADAAVTARTHAPFVDPVTLPERFAGAVYAYAAYIVQSFVPVGLSPYYSQPEVQPYGQIACGVVLLVSITAAAVIFRRSCPYLLVGWLWYVGTLIPVLGLSSVAGHARADRYMYLPQIGLDVALVWGLWQLCAAWPARRRALAVGSAVAVLVLMALSWRQSGFWQSPQALWQHAVECDPQNVTAHYHLGLALEPHDPAAAAAQYQRALEMGPNQHRIYAMVRAKANYSLGNLDEGRGDGAGAIAHYRQALDAYGDYVLAHMSLAVLLAAQGNLDEALTHFDRSSELQPKNADIWCRRAFALAEHHRSDEAIESFRKALEVDRNSSLAHGNLGILLTQRGDVEEAIEHFRRAIELTPDVVYPYEFLARLLRQQGKPDEAAEYERRGQEAGRRLRKP